MTKGGDKASSYHIRGFEQQAKHPRQSRLKTIFREYKKNSSPSTLVGGEEKAFTGSLSWRNAIQRLNHVLGAGVVELTSYILRAGGSYNKLQRIEQVFH
jgi:hypothetical protein